ncbi:hypothetical protein CDAR_431471 [Caerostris darwini]|uniref:Uncharacterized protein n=1 Tax=Caerostris darwini TaxID=1538125 RepID=A0AAV4W4N2_9ARAC|nr:hypothetical protein CDAR_431471 [Caerostris darwini]
MESFSVFIPLAGIVISLFSCSVPIRPESRMDPAPISGEILAIMLLKMCQSRETSLGNGYELKTKFLAQLPWGVERTTCLTHLQQHYRKDFPEIGAGSIRDSGRTGAEQEKGEITIPASGIKTLKDSIPSSKSFLSWEWR